MFGKLFGKEKPKQKTINEMSAEELKEMQGSIRKELRDSVRQVDRQIMESERIVKQGQKDLEKKIKEGASKQVQQMYAKNVVQARKLKEKHMATKIKIQGVEHSINQMLMSVKMTKVMGQATDLMKNVGDLAKIPEIQKNIMNM